MSCADVQAQHDYDSSVDGVCLVQPEPRSLEARVPVRLSLSLLGLSSRGAQRSAPGNVLNAAKFVAQRQRECGGHKTGHGPQSIFP